MLTTMLKLVSRELSEKEMDIKREYGINRFKNMSEENKQINQKNYLQAKK